VKWPYALNGLMSTAALLVPLTAATDSRIQTSAPGTSVSATAHVNFKIIIPTVLYLHVDGGSDRGDGAETVAIMSNGHNVTLNATTPDSTARSRGNVILSAAARKSIAQNAHCRLGLGQSARPAARQMICTVSTP
jgi:hypothetical protein